MGRIQGCHASARELASRQPLDGRFHQSIQLELISTRDTREVLGLYLAKFSELTCRDDGMMVAGEKSQKGVEEGTSRGYLKDLVDLLRSYSRNEDKKK
jgi:hypothetical protein